jgi:hypothetical protein
MSYISLPILLSLLKILCLIDKMKSLILGVILLLLTAAAPSKSTGVVRSVLPKPRTPDLNVQAPPSADAYLDQIKAQLFAGKIVDEHALSLRIETELNYIEKAGLIPSHFGTLQQLVAIHFELEFLSGQHGSSFKEFENLNRIILMYQQKTKDEDLVKLFKSVKAYVAKRNNSDVAEAQWMFYKNIPLDMFDNRGAEFIWNNLIDAQEDQGKLDLAVKTAQEWANDIRSDADYNFNALKKITTTATELQSQALFENAYKKMDFKKRKSDLNKLLLDTREKLYRKDLKGCEDSLNPALASAVNNGEYQSKYYQLKDQLLYCLLEGNKSAELAKLFRLKAPPALDLFLIKTNSEKKLNSDLKFQIILNDRKEAFKTCSTIVAKVPVVKPYKFARFLATCYALKTPSDVWPKEIIEKYSKELPRLVKLSEQSEDVKVMLQFIRETYPSYKLPAGTKSARQIIGNRFTKYSLINLAISSFDNSKLKK